MVDASVPVQPEVLREYALLADGERGALIGPRGDIVWMCVPNWQSDAVFSALVGGAGTYAVQPADSWFVWGGHYEAGSLIWRSRWMTATGAIECREALAFPGDPRTAVVLRRVEGLDRPADVRVVLDARAGFGVDRLRDLRQDGDVWTGLVGSLHLRWSGADEAREVDGCLVLRLVVPPGRWHDLVLELSDRPLSGAPPNHEHAWVATENQWRREVPRLGAVIGDRDARHAYAVLRGLTSASGGMVAAATTSLPERGEAGRDYDYRYAWIRDQSYAAQAVATHGAHPLVETACDFIAARVHEDGPLLRPVYTAEGGHVPREKSLPHLTGYPGGGNRVGNSMGEQFQLDVFGEALLVFAGAARHDLLDTFHWRAVDALVDAIEKRRGDPSVGIWETEEKRWAHSRLICASGLRQIAAVAPTARGASLTALADAMVADTTRDSLHPSGRWQRSPSDPRVDAALLLPAVRGGLPPEDPRSVATLQAVIAELTEDGYVYRFRHDQRPLRDAEGAFLLCGYFVALACQQRGDEVAARAYFERGRAACGPAGLYSEEYDVQQRQLRGNLPQAFVHALLLETACRLGRPSDGPDS